MTTARERAGQVMAALNAILGRMGPEWWKRYTREHALTVTVGDVADARDALSALARDYDGQALRLDKATRRVFQLEGSNGALMVENDRLRTRAERSGGGPPEVSRNAAILYAGACVDEDDAMYPRDMMGRIRWANAVAVTAVAAVARWLDAHGDPDTAGKLRQLLAEGSGPGLAESTAIVREWLDDGVPSDRLADMLAEAARAVPASRVAARAARNAVARSQ